MGAPFLRARSSGTCVFCPDDKTLMRLANGVRTCPKCGATMGAKAVKSLRVKGVVERRNDRFDDLGVIEDPSKFDVQIWPIDDQVRCGKCGNWGAFYYMRQTRRADEPTTRFYQCTKCKRKWKSGK